LTVPTWLFLTTGGAVVGASFLLASFVTDRSLIAAVHDWRLEVPLPGTRLIRWLLQSTGLIGLAFIIVVGAAGPATPVENSGYLLVWVGWWAGLVMVTYLGGNLWPAVNPWQTIAGWLPARDAPYPDRIGRWPAVVGLLALVWLEIVGLPAAFGVSLAPPQVIATLAVGYTALTLVGAWWFGASWFSNADPIVNLFRAYGHVGVAARNGEAFALRVPGAGLVTTDDRPGTVAFIVAILWATTFDGFVSTAAWRAMLDPVAPGPLLARALYGIGLIAGFVLFYGVFLVAVERSRAWARTHRSRQALAARFGPPLLAIAAGYHLAHYLPYFLEFLPALVTGLGAPMRATGTVLTLSLPDWFASVGIAAILGGHLLAIWAAHASAYRIFPGRLQAIRSQYPLVAVMVVYTMSSLWILSQPVIAPPYL
jgi:hypothetical protein